MKLVLDASVAVASIRPGEPDYAQARARLDRALQCLDVLIQPSTFRIEVAGALARRGLEVQQIRRLIDPLCACPHEIVTLGPKRAALAEELAIKARLRGPDALYVWLASSRGLPLCTLDRKMAERAKAFCTIVAP